MQEDLISFETAKLAKEKGFELDKYLSINDENPKNLNSNYNPRNYQPWYFDLTQSLLQKWLREVHKIDIMILPWEDTENNIVTYQYFVLNTFDEYKYDSYEKSLEKGLQKALKLINN